MDILPIYRDEEGEEVPGVITYDPSPEAVFNRIVPKFTMSLIYCALSDAYASEQSAGATPWRTLRTMPKK